MSSAPSASAIIRLAHPGEADAIRNLVHRSYEHYVARIGKPPGPMLDDYESRVAAAQCWVLVSDGQLEGMLMLEHQNEAMLLDNVAVAPGSQGKGHGRALLQFAEARARDAGCAAIVLYTHALMTENQALYRRIGYRETGRATEKGFERVYMQKDLV